MENCTGFSKDLEKIFLEKKKEIRNIIFFLLKKENLTFQRFRMYSYVSFSHGYSLPQMPVAV